MQKNEEYEGLVEDVGCGGEGIIKREDTTVFVSFCLTGEKVKYKILKCKDNIAYGKTERVITPSPLRAEPRCPVFGKCGGCDLQHMNYSAQLSFKRDSVDGNLRKIGGIYCGVNDTVPCEKQFNYRNKLVLPVEKDEDGLKIGFYAPRSHRIVDINSCAIQFERSADVISALRAAAPQMRAELIRHIVVREINGKFIFALVAREKTDPTPLIKQLEKTFKDFTFLVNINPGESNVIFGKKWITARGGGFYEGEDCGIKYKAGANTFLQVNDEMRAKLYAAVLDKTDGYCVAVDLYSGGGMLTAMLAKKCGKAYGIEVVEQASRCADELRDMNGLSGKMFNICGTVEDNLKRVLEDTEGRKRVIVCDPPRKGMERSVVKAIAASGADKVILISCNSATLARDAGLLCGSLKDINSALFKSDDCDGEYEIESITPYDMFPQTKHVETLMILTKKE